MRLIDADVLIDHLMEVMITANEFGNIERVSEIGGCIGVIKGEKTIERPHGEWIETDDGDEIYGPFNKCTHCGAEVLSTHMSYCGNCGAKMKEGGEK